MSDESQHEDGVGTGETTGQDERSSENEQVSERSSQHGDEEQLQPTEEDILRGEAATWLQRTIRGHVARRRALFTPIWAPYPAHVRPMVLGYQSFSVAQNVESAKRNHNFEEQIGLLGSVLEEGLSALPHLHQKELTRPMVHRRSRVSYLKGLVEFCVEMGDAYMRWGRGGPSEFMWQSVETLCTLPACEDTNATRSLDACNFKAKICYQIYALDQLAMINYKRGDYSQALQLLNKAQDASLHRSAGRLPYFLLQSHKAVVLSAMGNHDESYAILEEYVPSLQSATTNAMGDLELMETEKIVSHLLVISFHNLSVQLAHLKRWDEAIEITARVLSLVDSGMHHAQPIRKHFVHAHSASLRICQSSLVPAFSYSGVPEEQSHGDERRGANFDTSKLDTSQITEGKGRWNRWLALAGKGRAVAPLLIELYVPDASKLATLEHVPPRGYNDYTDVLDAAVQQFPKLDGMEVCPEEVLGSVSHAILHFVDEGSYASSTKAAADRFDQVEKLLDQDLFEFCEQLRWDVQVYGIFSKAAFLYNRVEDYEAAANTAQRALDKAREQDGANYQVAVCQLCIGACLLRAGQHDEAFRIGKTALDYCNSLSDEQLQDETVRVQMEDVLVGASHLMALSHIFLGHGQVALKLSKIAKNHIKNTSYYNNKSSIQYTQVSRVHEVAMSMAELMQDTHVSTSERTPKRVSKWVDKISSVVPNKFVPGALHRNLPAWYWDNSAGTGKSRRSISAISFGPPGEEIVQEVISRPSHKSSVEFVSPEPTMSDTNGSKRRYKWTGRYSASVDYDHSLDQQPHQGSIPSMTAPLMRHSDSALFHDKPRADEFSAVRSQLSSSHRTSKTLTGLTTAPTPYGNLLTSGLDAPPDPSLTGHQWVDELVHGKEEIRRRYSSDPASKMYFAQVYGRARDQNSLLLDPMAKVVPKKKYVVGDHLRPHVGGARAPMDVKPGGSVGHLPYLLRDWGPDPTRELRRFASSLPDSRLELQRSKGLLSGKPTMALEPEAADLTRDSNVASSADEGHRKLKLDLNEVRVSKHAPYDSVVRRSSLGLFVSRGERHAMLDDLDKHCNDKSTRPVTGLVWPKSRRQGSSLYHSSESRPFHWSHAPEPSPFLHAAKGQRIATNRHYRAMPYGANLLPPFKAAYGTNGAPAFGARSLQTVEVAQQAIVASAELSRKPETAGSIRSLSAFC